MMAPLRHFNNVPLWSQIKEVVSKKTCHLSRQISVYISRSIYSIVKDDSVSIQAIIPHGNWFANSAAQLLASAQQLA